MWLGADTEDKFAFPFIHAWPDIAAQVQSHCMNACIPSYASYSTVPGYGTATYMYGTRSSTVRCTDGTARYSLH
eukprot:COSAG02_NODE_28502_length_579_cov_0.948875_2_plen_73_part_01